MAAGTPYRLACRSVTKLAVVVALCCAFIAPAMPAHASDDAVVIDGVGAAHGFGMAMDGVQGQARAGWSHEQILSLFYPGTTISHTAGPIRVGLARTAATSLTLPAGGLVADATRGAKGTFATSIGPGKSVSLRIANGKIAMSGITVAHPLSSVVKPTPTPKPSMKPLIPPALRPPTPTPHPKRTATPAPVAPQQATYKTLWIWGTAGNALVQVGATGRRYRGIVQVTATGGQLLVTNVVDLETYVAGIAEEKGQGWPGAGMRALAIAARSLAAATMTWYHANHDDGYDICPDANCQVYLGYDGEEASMREAARATAGEIRTYHGRAILAMYHGNGGGQTESYAAAINNGTDPYPYLQSVRYPFASPSHWQVDTTMGSIEASLRSAGVAVPTGLRRITITKRGVSPRVLALELAGTGATTAISGNAFAAALDLRSTWFDIDDGTRLITPVSTNGLGSPLGSATIGGTTVDQAKHAGWTSLFVATFAMILLAAAVALASETIRRESVPTVVPAMG